MRKHWLDNIRWVTVLIVVIYHLFYMYNAEGIVGVVGKITSMDVQWFDIFMYIVYPWMMVLLFIVSGISSRLYLENHTNKEFVRSRTTKLLVPSTIGLLAFQFIQGYVNMSLGGYGGIQHCLIPAPKHIIIDKDENGDYTTKLFAKEQSHKSMLKILGY